MATSFTLTFQDAAPDAVELLGGKGAGLARLAQEGLPVPPGYIISTDASRMYLANRALPDGLADEVLTRLAELESATGKSFGTGPLPLLLSVRSGAPVSMPGMMDTILNLGLCRDAALALADATRDTRFMADLLVRFHRMYSETVLGAVDAAMELDAQVAGVAPDADPGEVYDRLWKLCEDLVRADVGQGVPDDPRQQLIGAVEAVFRSWNNRRARTYRDFHKISHDLGTAVVVQSMVFGNLSSDSGSGVAFTRNPVTGERELFGEFLRHSQGEDVVSGKRTPEPIGQAAAELPAVFGELRHACEQLELRYADVLDIEFTVERSRLYLLQVRSAKRTPEAAVRIAADLLRERVVLPRQALGTVSAEQVRQVQRPGFDPDEVASARAAGRVLATGIGACPGQVSGRLVLDPERAVQVAASGARVILARPITSPADLHGMIAAQGIVTGTGGATSHAAVVARALGKACVVGCAQLRIDPSGRTATAAGRTIVEGDEVSVDGTTGELFVGALAQSSPAASNADLQWLLRFARDRAGCEVFGRVTLPQDVAAAQSGGATGLVTAVDDVLAATGHLDGLVQALLDQADVSTLHLAELEEAIAAEFAPLFTAAGDLEVGVRAIDFLADDSRELLHQTALVGHHPALSVPLGLPALVEAQLAGLARAASDAGSAGQVHLAVRNVSDPSEAVALREIGQRVARQRGVQGAVKLGTYLTSPRAAVNSRQIAAASEVMWLEIRMLQAAMFGIPPRQLLTEQPLGEYVRRGLLSSDPRSTIDPSVDRLLAGVTAGAAESPGCELGVRLSGPVAEQVADRLYALGFRRFAVDAYEARPLALALGKAALSAQPA